MKTEKRKAERNERGNELEVGKRETEISERGKEIEEEKSSRGRKGKGKRGRTEVKEGKKCEDR